MRKIPWILGGSDSFHSGMWKTPAQTAAREYLRDVQEHVNYLWNLTGHSCETRAKVLYCRQNNWKGGMWNAEGIRSQSRWCGRFDLHGRCLGSEWAVKTKRSKGRPRQDAGVGFFFFIPRAAWGAVRKITAKNKEKITQNLRWAKRRSPKISGERRFC